MVGAQPVGQMRQPRLGRGRMLKRAADRAGAARGQARAQAAGGIGKRQIGLFERRRKRGHLRLGACKCLFRRAFLRLRHGGFGGGRCCRRLCRRTQSRGFGAIAQRPRQLGQLGFDPRQIGGAGGGCAASSGASACCSARAVCARALSAA
ncbi:hypothetical protein PUH89_08300 [Rhodobacter capsulatus]|uniref:hypothetical protein n=1 Tax=Rhodobacter capsulatus TaxID=1061 RepID=UPI0023E32B37|nr:hypothetical protein [Rhodobacter capsulatus]WER10962.1 hypothetical protein PUH89_08300 [Rhodobacter capsulatus]